MKEADIKKTLAQVEADMTSLNVERDVLTEKLRALSAKKADLEALAKIIDMPPSKLRAQVIKAAGIESNEAVMSGD